MALIVGSPPQQPAEEKVFRILARGFSDDWIIASGTKFRRDEGTRIWFSDADILLASPYHGFIFIEVKGGQIRRQANRWEQRQNGVWKTIDPVDQASGAQRHILAYLKRNGLFTRKRNIPSIPIVAFPDCARPDHVVGPELDHTALFGLSEIGKFPNECAGKIARSSAPFFIVDRLIATLFPEFEATALPADDDIAGSQAILNGLAEITRELKLLKPAKVDQTSESISQLHHSLERLTKMVDDLSNDDDRASILESVANLATEPSNSEIRAKLVTVEQQLSDLVSLQRGNDGTTKSDSTSVEELEGLVRQILEALPDENLNDSMFEVQEAIDAFARQIESNSGNASEALDELEEVYKLLSKDLSRIITRITSQEARETARVREFKELRDDIQRLSAVVTDVAMKSGTPSLGLTWPPPSTTNVPRKVGFTVGGLVVLVIVAEILSRIT